MPYTQPSAQAPARPDPNCQAPHSEAEIDWMVYARLIWHARGKGLAWPRDSTLARDLGLTEAQVVASLARLAAAGQVKAEYRGERRYLLVQAAYDAAPSRPPL